MRHTTCLTALALLASLAITPPASAAQSYSILDLGTYPGEFYSAATGINASGHVTGWVIPAGPIQQLGFITKPGQTLGYFNYIGTFGPYSYQSVPSHINDSGVIVGAATIPPGHNQAFILAPGDAALTDLGTFTGGYESAAASINNAGQVVGWSDSTSGARAFRISPGGRVGDPGSNLGVLPGGANSQASSINASGQVAGESQNSRGFPHAFRISATGDLSDPAADLGTLGGLESAANAINDSGLVVGWANTASGATHAFRTSPTGAITPDTDLGTLPGGTSSSALAINNLGQTVGESNISSSGPTDAFLINLTGPMIDLNDLLPAGSPWHLYEATAINDSGVIVGDGKINGQDHAFVLIPTPEPATLSFIALAAGSLLLKRRRPISS
ncbi:MAG: DUF3466 family protein [Phycisphaerae bacterium]